MMKRYIFKKHKSKIIVIIIIFILLFVGMLFSFGAPKNIEIKYMDKLINENSGLFEVTKYDTKELIGICLKDFETILGTGILISENEYPDYFYSWNRKEEFYQSIDNNDIHIILYKPLRLYAEVNYYIYISIFYENHFIQCFTSLEISNYVFESRSDVDEKMNQTVKQLSQDVMQYYKKYQKIISEYII